VEAGVASTAARKAPPMTRTPNDGRAPMYGSDDRAGPAIAVSERAAPRTDRVEPRAVDRGSSSPTWPAPVGALPSVAPVPPDGHSSGGQALHARAALPASQSPLSTASAPLSTAASAPPVAGSSERLRGSAPSAAEKSERLLGVEEIDARLAALEQPQGTSVDGEMLPTDLAEVRSLFTQLAANHVRPVRDFMLDLRSGDASVDWLPLCEPALRSLRRAAAKLGLLELCASLDRFGDALSRVQRSGSPSIGGEERQTLLASYEELGRTLPQAFALDRDRRERETVILQSLLLQVAGVRKITFDKLVGAGLWALEAMFLATAADIASTTGIDRELAQQIVDRFREYRAQVRSAAPDPTRARERQRIADLASRLRREHDDYESASQSWSREAASAKKRLRCARARTMLDIRVELARLGEVEWLTHIERLPFEKKIEELDVFLDEARDKYGAQPGC